MDGGSTTVGSLSVLPGGALLVQVVCPVSGMLVQVVVCPEGTSLVGEGKGIK